MMAMIVMMVFGDYPFSNYSYRLEIERVCQFSIDLVNR